MLFYLSPVLLRAGLLALALVLALPVLSMMLGWLLPLSGSAKELETDNLRHLLQTVLPQYSWVSLQLCLMVALGCALLGVGSAVCVTLHEFRGRKVWDWLLLLPLAMPAYVVAYAYTDFLQFAGPLQTSLRHWSGLEGRLFPEVRNVYGAAWVMIFTLYPYVYLLARTALTERAGQLMEAASLLGAGPWRSLWQVALPLIRPAVAAGVALALMEALADYGVTSYFGVQSFTTGIYKAWLNLDDRQTAVRLAGFLLLWVVALTALEKFSRKQQRYSSNKSLGSRLAQPLRRANAWGKAALHTLCAIPVLFGFVLPIIFMLVPLGKNWHVLPWHSFGLWAWGSVRLAVIAALCTSAFALLLLQWQRLRRSTLAAVLCRVTGLGYAIPGAVVVMGILFPLYVVQTYNPGLTLNAWISGGILGLMWAYMIRFTAVALGSLESGYTRIPQSLDETARVLGKNDTAIGFQVHIPLLYRSLLAAILLVFVDVMKELPATLVLRPFNSDTLAVVTWQLATDERLGEAALPAMALVLVGLVPVLLLNRLLRQGR